MVSGILIRPHNGRYPYDFNTVGHFRRFLRVKTGCDNRNGIVVFTQLLGQLFVEYATTTAQWWIFVIEHKDIHHDTRFFKKCRFFSSKIMVFINSYSSPFFMYQSAVRRAPSANVYLG